MYTILLILGYTLAVYNTISIEDRGYVELAVISPPSLVCPNLVEIGTYYCGYDVVNKVTGKWIVSPLTYSSVYKSASYIYLHKGQCIYLVYNTDYGDIRYEYKSVSPDINNFLIIIFLVIGVMSIITLSISTAIYLYYRNRYGNTQQ